MINRIRAIRKDKGMTLVDLAEACSPPTTPQTIGRLETGMRTLSIDWLNRIAAALGVEPEALLASETKAAPMVVARLGADGAEALPKPREAVPPEVLLGDNIMGVLEIEVAQGEYRPGDRLWLRELSPAQTSQAINRDVLVPRSGGRFAFGRLIDRSDGYVAVLPPGTGQRQTVIMDPAWVALGVMLVRML
ncbi:XRE family transcriptional regulator [Croceicoccus ponticola]|uniref:XRE family transcriptional regulator n=1 Tax=Croceicoccus ponticola TaxID=2217664 RepID=A0A437GVE3_9SPHN|nr:helix-turn-helix transcriptional regulator [Croceicoccus ponticola]RVQ65756.1 XRE family transcriptional regulator [Croceicoccus ponticola]